MSTWGRTYNKDLFERPLLEFGAKWHKVRLNGPRTQYDKIRRKGGSFKKFVEAVREVNQSEDPAARMTPLKGKLSEMFPHVWVLKESVWNAYYELDNENSYLYGLMVTAQRLGSKELGAQLAKAQKETSLKPVEAKKSE